MRGDGGGLARGKKRNHELITARVGDGDVGFVILSFCICVQFSMMKKKFKILK